MEVVKTVDDNVVRIIEVKIKEEPSKNDAAETVRLTPTGKISHAKTRVYTQRYRKEWEHMPDFSDWLTSVPYQATRAFCKYCQRNLHAHRLSLLKHMCTLKHQRAAVQYNKSEAAKREHSNDINYIVESLDDDDDNEDGEEENDSDQNNETENIEDDDDNNETAEYIEEVGEELSIEGEIQEEVIEESEDIDQTHVFKKICIQKSEAQDTLAQAMSHVHSDYLTENEEPIELQMEVESVHENDEDDSKPYQYVKYENSSNSKDIINLEKQDTINKSHKEIADEAIKTLIAESKGSLQTEDNSKKVFYFSAGGKTYSLVKSKLPPVAMNQLNDKNFVAVTKGGKNNKKSKDIVNINGDSVATTSHEFKKNCISDNTTTVATKSHLLHKSVVSTHVLETSKGVPVSGLQVSLYKLQDGRWTFIHESTTTANGICNDFAVYLKNNLTTGRYKFHYDVEKYYNMRKLATIYPFIEIVFDIKDPNASYHIPLLVSPFSYSTFKDSPR